MVFKTSFLLLKGDVVKGLLKISNSIFLFLIIFMACFQDKNSGEFEVASFFGLFIKFTPYMIWQFFLVLHYLKIYKYHCYLQFVLQR